MPNLPEVAWYWWLLSYVAVGVVTLLVVTIARTSAGDSEDDVRAVAFASLKFLLAWPLALVFWATVKGAVLFHGLRRGGRSTRGTGD